MKPMSHYEFQRLVYLVKIDPTNLGGRNHLVSMVQQQGIRNNYGCTPIDTVSLRRKIEKKYQDQKRKMDMDKSAVTRKLH